MLAPEPCLVLCDVLRYSNFEATRAVNGDCLRMGDCDDDGRSIRNILVIGDVRGNERLCVRLHYFGEALLREARGAAPRGASSRSSLSSIPRSTRRPIRGAEPRGTLMVARASRRRSSSAGDSKEGPSPNYYVGRRGGRLPRVVAGFILSATPTSAVRAGRSSRPSAVSEYSADGGLVTRGLRVMTPRS